MIYNLEIIIKRLYNIKNDQYLNCMARFGINTENAIGINMKEIRNFAKEIKQNQELAEKLWKTEIHEARILASIIANPNTISYETKSKCCRKIISCI